MIPGAVFAVLLSSNVLQNPIRMTFLYDRNVVVVVAAASACYHLPYLPIHDILRVKNR